MRQDCLMYVRFVCIVGLCIQVRFDILCVVYWWIKTNVVVVVDMGSLSSFVSLTRFYLTRTIGVC